jgi:hypothetical protein
MDVHVSGPAAKVQDQVRTSSDQPKKPEENGSDEKSKFLEALRNPKYLARVKRLTPRELDGKKINFEVFTSELPLTLQDIMGEVQKSNGGGKFRAAVMDPELNTTVAAYVFEVDGDPIIPQVEMTPEEKLMFMQGTEPKDAATLTEEGLERQARLTAKQIEYENLAHQLKEARESRTGGNLKASNGSDTKIDDLERRIIDAKHAADVERIQREADKKIDEFGKKFDQLLQRQQAPQGPSEITLVLAQMQKSQEASDRRFDAMQAQAKDDKMNILLDEMKALRNRPAKENGSMLEMADAMLKMKKLFGWGDDEDEDGDDPDDDRPWYERALEKLGDKIVPKLLEKFDAMEGGGQKVTREDFMREMDALARKAEDEAVARAKGRIAATLPPSPLHVLPPPGPVTTLPPPAPAQALPPPPAPAPTASAPAAPRVPTIQEEILIRVGGVLEIISREIELQPNEYHWVYEGAWQTLSRPILEKVCQAADPAVMIDAFTVEGINMETLAALKARISGTPGIMAWLATGLGELKEWWAQKLVDPKFDPYAEEEGEED